MKNKLTKLATAVLLTASAIVAHAVPSYGNIASVPGDADGIYFGSGNVNGNFTIDTSNGIEVALRAKNRSTLATIDGSSGVYHAQPGLCNTATPACGGGPKAMWNYEFSVNVGSTDSLTNYFVIMSVDTDASAGVAFTDLNVFTNWTDNAYWNGARRIGPGVLSGEYGVQQSANPLFGDSGFMPGFNPFGPGTYDLMLSVYGKDANGAQGDLLAQTRTTVQVPEPGSLALAALGLAGLGFGRRRKTAK